MIFDSEMWHPNVYSTSDKKGEVCISILVSFNILSPDEGELMSSTHQGMMNGDMKMQERGGYPFIPSRLS
jgi:ubiquitin-protein ligase